MRSYEEFRQIMTLWEEGNTQTEIQQITGIPRETVKDCIKRYGTLEALQQVFRENGKKFRGDSLVVEKLKASDVSNDFCKSYAYLLGLYLGDGSISILRKVYRLRVTLDARYPGIIETCKVNLQVLLPNNQVGEIKRYNGEKLSCVDVSCFYKYWPDVFPQHGEGEKHLRQIELELWQQKIVDAHLLEFWRGLYHSDGSRSSNVINGKDYPRYQFTNSSSQIIALFCKTCDKLGIHWTAKTRKAVKVKGTLTQDVFIAKRKDVEYLDRVVGPKR